MYYVRAHTHTHTHQYTTPACDLLLILLIFFPPVHSIRFQETRIGAYTRNRKRLCLFGGTGTNRNNVFM